MVAEGGYSPAALIFEEFQIKKGTLATRKAAKYFVPATLSLVAFRMSVVELSYEVLTKVFTDNVRIGHVCA